MRDKYWTIRNYRARDFENLARLHLEADKRDQSGQHVSKLVLAERLGHPRFHPENTLFLAERDQNLIGYASVFLEPGIGRALLDGLVHPDCRREGVATDLFRYAVGHAKAAGIKTLQICIPESNLAAKNMVLGLGLRFIRHFWGYKLNLSSIQPAHVIPGQYIYRSLQPGEEEALTDIQNRSFADTWGFNANTREEIHYRIHAAGCSPENIIMVYLEDRPVGYCWARIYHEGNPAQAELTGEIHMLGVDPDFRNQSIGRNVLRASLLFLKQKGVEIVELMADSEMPAALALYESAGFKKYTRSEWYEIRL